MADKREFAALLREHARKRLGTDAARLGKLTSQSDIDNVAKWLKTGPAMARYRAGLYYTGEGTIDTHLTVNQNEFTGPVVIDSFMIVDEIGIEISVAGTEGNFYTVLRADRGDGYPGEIVHVSAALTVTAAFKSTTGLSIPLPPGLYWAGVAVNGVVTTAPTVRSLVINSPYVGHTAGASSANAAGYSQTGVTGAPSGAFSDIAANIVEAPMVKLKCKSM